MSLSKTELLTRCQRRFIDVSLPDAGVVKLQSLTELERSQLELRMFDKAGKVAVSKLPEAKLRTLAACMVGEDQQRLFTDAEWGDLQSLDSGIIAVIYSACLKHIGFEDDEIEELSGN